MFCDALLQKSKSRLFCSLVISFSQPWYKNDYKLWWSVSDIGKYKQDFLHSLVTSLNDSVLYNNDNSYNVNLDFI